MKTYKTSEVANIIGVHPNTVRLYEKWELLPCVTRANNGYRIYTQFHIAVFKLARTAFQIEVIHAGLRNKIIEVIKNVAKENYEVALRLLDEYNCILTSEIQFAEEAICAVENMLQVNIKEPLALKRKEVAAHINVSVDTLRNWERNALLHSKRLENGYRIYTEEDIERLKIIRTLRYANYSLESIRRLMKELDNQNVKENTIQQILNTPKPNEYIISVCDCLLVSLTKAQKNTKIIEIEIKKLEKKI